MGYRGGEWRECGIMGLDVLKFGAKSEVGILEKTDQVMADMSDRRSSGRRSMNIIALEI